MFPAIPLTLLALFCPKNRRPSTWSSSLYTYTRSHLDQRIFMKWCKIGSFPSLLLPGGMSVLNGRGGMSVSNVTSSSAFNERCKRMAKKNLAVHYIKTRHETATKIILRQLPQ